MNVLGIFLGQLILYDYGSRIEFRVPISQEKIEELTTNVKIKVFKSEEEVDRSIYKDFYAQIWDMNPEE